MKARRPFSAFLAIVLIVTMMTCAIPASAAGGSINRGEVVELADAQSLTRGYLVFYPKALETSNKTWPVVVWANGTMCLPALYTEFLKSVAQAGYVVVASSEVMSADGKDQIKSIDYILGKNSNPKSVFYNRINANAIAAAGHSQGGRSSVNAAAADKRFKCVVSIAGSSYTSEAKKLSAPALFLTGTADLVVPSGIWVKPAYNKVTGPAAYAALKGGVHTTVCTSPKAIANYTVLWLNAWLLGDAQAKTAFTAKGSLSKDTAWKSFTCKGIR